MFENNCEKLTSSLRPSHCGPIFINKAKYFLVCMKIFLILSHPHRFFMGNSAMCMRVAFADSTRGYIVLVTETNYVNMTWLSCIRLTFVLCLQNRRYAPSSTPLQPEDIRLSSIIWHYAKRACLECQLIRLVCSVIKAVFVLVFGKWSVCVFSLGNCFSIGSVCSRGCWDVFGSFPVRLVRGCALIKLWKISRMIYRYFINFWSIH